MATFKGWPEDFQRFFIGLELDNSKKYFEANRRAYEDSVKGPMAALLESLEPDFGPGKVFRANRDIRFSKDKSPYKTNIAADVGMGSKGGYLSLDARGFTVATGRYVMSPEEIARHATHPGLGDALRLRRWDDLAKVVGKETAPLADWEPLLRTYFR